MKRYLISLSLIIACLLSACNSKQQNNKLNVPTDTIEFHNFKESSFTKLPENLIAGKKFINLEINNGTGKGYFGIVSKLSIVNGKIYVLDKRKKRLIVYSDAGKYIGSVSNLGTDYLNIADFDVDDKGTIYLIDGKLDNIIRYDSHFQLIGKRKLPYEVDILQHLSNNTFLLGLSSWNKNAAAGEKLILADDKLNIIQHIVNYDEFTDDNFWISDYQFMKTNKEIFYNKSIDNNVYIFSLEGKPEKSYFFNFGKMNVPDEDKKNIQEKLAKFENYRVLTDFTIVEKNFALGRIWDKKQQRFFFADRANKIVYLENLKLPNEFKHPVDYDGTNLISFIYPGEYNNKYFDSLPEGSKRHLENGGVVVCSYEIKK